MESERHAVLTPFLSFGKAEKRSKNTIQHSFQCRQISSPTNSYIIKQGQKFGAIPAGFPNGITHCEGLLIHPVQDYTFQLVESVLRLLESHAGLLLAQDGMNVSAYFFIEVI